MALLNIFKKKKKKEDKSKKGAPVTDKKVAEPEKAPEKIEIKAQEQPQITKTETPIEKKPAAKPAAAAKPAEAPKPAEKVEPKKAVPQTKTAPKTEVKAAPKAEIKAEPKPEAKAAKPKAAPKTEAKTEDKVEPKAAKPKAEASQEKKAEKPEVKVEVPTAEIPDAAADTKGYTGRFEINKSKDGKKFFFNLYASNKVGIATSQMYSTAQSALNGVKSVIANAAKAPIEDQSLKKYETLPFPKWEIYIDNGGKYRFRLNASNGSCVCHSQGYTTKTACKNGIDSIIRSSRNAEIDKTYITNK